MMNYNGAMYGFLYNVQGDVVALFDQSGEVTVRYRYGAWGELLRCWGVEAETVGFWQPFRYRGYLWDWETGDYYCRSRQYRAEWGRFLNADELIGGNLYRYCNNAPVFCVDADGHETIWMAALIEEPAIANSFDSLGLEVKVPHYPIGASASSALAQLEAAQVDIIYASRKTGVPIAAIQAVAFRETICYGIDDVVTDWLPGRSKGMMQIKAKTAYTSEMYFNQNSSVTVKALEVKLNERRENIYYAALTLAYWAAQCDINLTAATDEDMARVFSSYNSGTVVNAAGPYGRATLSYYKAFSRHIEEMVEP